MSNLIIRFTKKPTIIIKTMGDKWEILRKCNQIAFLKYQNHLWYIYPDSTMIKEWRWEIQNNNESGIRTFDFNNKGLCLLNIRNTNWILAMFCREVIENDNSILKIEK
jgi:hypothetical protein